MTNLVKYRPSSMTGARRDPAQNVLPGFVVESEVTEGMGVLSDGTPFLTQRGLAAFCGVQNAHIGTISREWMADPPRVVKIKEILAEDGLALARPHIPVMDGSREIFAYPAEVCAAVIEYYAFLAPQPQPEAQVWFRRFARKSLRDFIYQSLGYKPSSATEFIWQQFHDRVALNHDSVPLGYFSVFKELADLIVTLIRAGAHVGPEFVPDISVGRLWSDHWLGNNFEAQFGGRVRYEHNYPDYFPQAVSNPQVPWAYPNSALGAFRDWMEQVYLKDRLPKYLEKHERQGKLPKQFTATAVAAIAGRKRPKAIL